MVASSAISLPETVMLRDLADSSGVSSLPLNIKDQRRYFEGHRQTDLDTTVSTTSTPCSPEKVRHLSHFKLSTNTDIRVDKARWVVSHYERSW